MAAKKTRAVRVDQTIASSGSPSIQDADVNAGSASLSPVDTLYNAFVAVFGNTNPSQVFSLVWPGTILDPSSFADPDSSGPVPVLTSIAQSLLFDQYYPVATVTQPDGTRVSDRYAQAIERYGPVPNAALLQLQTTLRDRLNQTTQMSIDGKMVTMTLIDQFNYLDGIWTSKRQAWADLQAQQLATLQASGNPNWWEAYVVWYGITAQPQIDAINAAYDRLVAEFPLNAFQDAIAILSTQEAAALLRARNDLTNATVPIPPQIGDQYVVSQAVPADWGAELVSSTTFIDLLAAPDAQQASLDQAIAVLQQQIFGWNAVLAQIPAGSRAEIQAALDAFNQASTSYTSAINNLLTTYTNNAVTAVKVYSQYKAGTTQGNTDGANNLLTELDKQNGTTSNPLSTADYTKIATELGTAQNNLIGANSSMVSAGVELGRKATALLHSKAGEGLRAIITPVIDRLTAQLTILQQQVANVQSSSIKTLQLAGVGPAGVTGVAVPDPSMPSTADSLLDQRWESVVIDIDSTSMQTASTTSTAFSQFDWSVDLFFGSAGGESTSMSSAFASQYMDASSSIKIGMLATKVLIERPWMHPELFNLSSSYYRVSTSPLTTPAPGTSGWTRDILVATALGGGATPGAAAAATEAINEGPFPAYPVALLLVKDVTIKMKMIASQTDALDQQSQQNSQEGGGFLCFSISSTQSSSSSTKSAGSYAMGGTYVFRIAAPQVAGAWLQITPPDLSAPLDSTLAKEIADSLGFVTRIQAVATAGRQSVRAPSRPSAGS